MGNLVWALIGLVIGTFFGAVLRPIFVGIWQWIKNRAS